MKFVLISLALLLTLLIQTEGTISWSQLASNVCFQTRSNNFGSLRYYGHSLFVGALKLVHRNGYVRCWNKPSANSRWGCHGLHIGDQNHVLNVVITDEMNHMIYPKKESIVHTAGLWYILPGVHELGSKELTFTDFATPFYLQKLMYLRVWYGEDLKGWTEEDNYGRVCVDVYAHFL